jgi:hypothetical protein
MTNYHRRLFSEKFVSGADNDPDQMNDCEMEEGVSDLVMQ